MSTHSNSSSRVIIEAVIVVQSLPRLVVAPLALGFRIGQIVRQHKGPVGSKAVKDLVYFIGRD